MLSTVSFSPKLVLLGDSGVGKTSLINHFVDSSYSATIGSTIGQNNVIKTVHRDGRTVKLAIWDTAGQEQFQALVPLYLTGASFVIIVFSVNCQESFNHVTFWLEKAKDKVPDADLVLVGNKIDVKERIVSISQGQGWASAHAIPYMETSALTGEGVNDVFDALIDGYLKRVRTGWQSMSEPNIYPYVELNVAYPEEAPRCCLSRREESSSV
jgi:small GTP-binding protein